MFGDKSISRLLFKCFSNLLNFVPMWTMRAMEVIVAMTPERALESPRSLQPGNPEYSLLDPRRFE